MALMMVAGLLQGEASGSQAQEPVFATVAEGLTSVDEQHGIKVAFRMFAGPEFDVTCAAAPRPSTLVPRPGVVRLKLGERFPLNQLVVVARDAAGRPLKPVPIAIDVEDMEPALLNLQSDKIEDSRLLVLRRGRFHFRVRTFCPGVSVSTLIAATVK